MKFKIIITVLLLSSLLVACGSKNESVNSNKVTNNSDNNVTDKNNNANSELADELYKQTEKPKTKDAILLNVLNTNIEDGFYNYGVISEKAKIFFANHLELFPPEGEIDPNYINWDLQRKHINKDIQSVGDYLFNLNGTIAEIRTYDSSYGLGKISEMHVVDNDYNSYDVIYYGDIPDKYDNDSISIVGLPYAEISYDNVSGGVTKSIYVVAATAK